jgi:hypothetical protein
MNLETNLRERRKEFESWRDAKKERILVRESPKVTREIKRKKSSLLLIWQCHDKK